jgi:hypothetical protein
MDGESIFVLTYAAPGDHRLLGDYAGYGIQSLPSGETWVDWDDDKVGYYSSFVGEGGKDPVNTLRCVWGRGWLNVEWIAKEIPCPVT